MANIRKCETRVVSCVFDRLLASSVLIRSRSLHSIRPREVLVLRVVCSLLLQSGRLRSPATCVGCQRSEFVARLNLWRRVVFHQVVQAITALYDQRNPAQQQEANTWLTSFSATDGAWEAGVNLLGVGATEASDFRPVSLSSARTTHVRYQVAMVQLCEKRSRNNHPRRNHDRHLCKQRGFPDRVLDRANGRYGRVGTFESIPVFTAYVRQ
eukprot:8787388-Pyramimonas_sp.AAC.1